MTLTPDVEGRIPPEQTASGQSPVRVGALLNRIQPTPDTIVLLVAAWIAQIGLGAEPAFALPAYEVRSLLELPLYVGLGVLASFVSIFYQKTGSKTLPF